MTEPGILASEILALVVDSIICMFVQHLFFFTQIMYPPLSSLQHLSMLPLMEPLIGVNFAHFPPYGSGQLNGENRLSGSFGSASLNGVSDYYSQLIYKVWLLCPSLPNVLCLCCVDMVHLQI